MFAGIIIAVFRVEGPYLVEGLEELARGALVLRAHCQQGLAALVFGLINMLGWAE
jgi:hypothetical protein